MVDYKPHFQPMYTRYGVTGEKSLSDRVNESYNSLVDALGSLKYKNWTQVKDDFVTTSKNDYTNTIDTIVNNKAANVALGVGLITSLAANRLGSHIANVNGYQKEGIEWLSMLGEWLVHAMISGTSFVLAYKSAGVSWKDTKKNLATVIKVTLPISVLYALGRNHTAGGLMDSGLKPENATPIAQLIWMPAYIWMVNKGLKLAGYTNGKNKVKTMYPAEDEGFGERKEAV